MRKIILRIFSLFFSRKFILTLSMLSFNPYGVLMAQNNIGDVIKPDVIKQEKKGEQEIQEFLGLLQTGIMAIGGETTGTILITDQGEYDLIFENAHLEEHKKKLQELKGKKIKVTGKVLTIEGIERPRRMAIKVISWEKL